MFQSSAVSSHRLGDLLLSKKLLTAAELDEAVAAQRECQLPLGQILLQRKLITQRQLDRNLKRQTMLRKAVIVAALSFTPLSLVHADNSEPVSDSHHSRDLADHAKDLLDVAGKWLPDSYYLSSDDSNRPINAASSLFIQPGRDQLQKMSFTESRYDSVGWHLVKGEYRGGVTAREEGFQYKAKWSKNSLKLQANYNF